MITLGVEGGLAGALLALGALAALAWTRFLHGRPGSARSQTLLALRAAALSLVALCALQIVVVRSRSRLERPRLAVLVDTGPTMGASDGMGRTRLARAVRWLKEHRRALEAKAEPVLYAGSDRARRVGWEELDALALSAASLDYEAALQDVADDGRAPRLWLLSDGNTEGDPGAEGRWAVPVDALGVGPRRTAKAVYLSDLQTPDFVFLHARFPVSVRLEAVGLAGGSVLARLYKADPRASGATVPQGAAEVSGGDSIHKGWTLVEERRLPVRGDYEVSSATFTAGAEALGREQYRLELAVGGSGERLAARPFAVEVIRQKHRIMYLAGRPSPEYAHLREQLKANPNFELVSFVILRNPENVSPVPDGDLSLIPFPAHEIFVQNLMQFDLFILEDFAYWRFNLPAAYLDGLKRFVAGGGALLVIGGSNAYSRGGYRGTPLEEVLPVALWGAADDYAPGLFTPRVTAPEHPLLRLGETPEASAALWGALPPLDGFNRFAAARPEASVLLAHPSEKTPEGAPMPLLAVREYGKGKVMALGTDSTWRWRLGAGAQWRTASFYGRFWAKAVQYLSGTLELKKVKFSPLPERLPPREPAVVSLRLFDESFRPLPWAEADVRALWTPPDGRSRAVAGREREPGLYEFELTGLAEGTHGLRAVVRRRGAAWGEDQVRFVWEPKPPEAPLQRQWLSRAAERSGGRYADLEQAPVDGWLAALPEAKREAETIRRRHVWAWTGWLWALAGLLLLEWALRRRWGRM